MRRVWGRSKWRHGLGWCWLPPNQMGEEQGVQTNDNRTRGEDERETLLGKGLRWAKRGKILASIPSSDCISDRAAAEGPNGHPAVYKKKREEEKRKGDAMVMVMDWKRG